MFLAQAAGGVCERCAAPQLFGVTSLEIMPMLAYVNICKLIYVSMCIYVQTHTLTDHTHTHTYK